MTAGLTTGSTGQATPDPEPYVPDPAPPDPVPLEPPVPPISPDPLTPDPWPPTPEVLEVGELDELASLIPRGW